MYQPDSYQDSAGRDGRSSLSRTEPGSLDMLEAASLAMPAVRAGGPTGGGRSFSLGRLLRYKWSILLVAVLVAALAIPAIWVVVKPKYAAQAEIRVRPIIPRLVFSTDDNGMIPFYQQYVNTQVSIMHSPQVLMRVLDREDVRNTAWYRAPAAMPGQTAPPALERLLAELDARPRGLTELIDVSMATRDAADSAVLVNAVVDEYIKLVGELNTQSSDVLYRKLVEEYRSLRDELDGRRRVVAQMRKDLGTGDPQELVARRRVRLDEAEARLQEIRRQIALAQWQQKELQALQPAPQPGAETDESDQPAKPEYQQDAEWRRLYLAARTAQHQVDIESANFGPGHPRMLALKAGAEFAAKLLEEHQAQLDVVWTRFGTLPSAAADGSGGMVADLAGIERNIRQLRYEEGLMQAEVSRQMGVWESAFESAQVLTRELEAIREKEELYTAVQTRLGQKEMERNVPGSIEVLTRAQAPSRPTRDRRPLLSMMALVGGLGAGVALAFVRMNRDQSIYEAEDVVEEIRAPFLGHLPLATNSQGGPEDDPAVREGIRMLRTALLQRLDTRRGSTVLVASPGPGEGKTTVAVMLARSLSQCGKKVLLVDADLRNSTVASRMNLPGEKGLTSALQSDGDCDEGILRSAEVNLDVLPAGVNGNGADPELLANGIFSKRIAHWRETYDLILMDSPPMLLVADAQILAQHADGVLMIVRKSQCQRADLYSALSMLGDPRRQLLGTVFLGSSRRKTYGYGYSPYQYSYAQS